MVKFSGLIFVSAALLFAGNASATLITCVDNGIVNNKLVGSSINTGTGSSAVVSSSECGPWSGNDSNGLTIATGGYGSSLFDSVLDPDGWVELDKADNGVDGALITGTGWGGTMGTFSFADAGYDDYLIVLKYGQVYSSFLSDSWAVNWGWNTDIDADGKFALSHLTVYVRSPGSVPEPAMVALLAIGILGMVVVRRKM